MQTGWPCQLPQPGHSMILFWLNLLQAARVVMTQTRWGSRQRGWTLDSVTGGEILNPSCIICADAACLTRARKAAIASSP